MSASSDNTLRVWDLASGKSLQNIEGHTSEVSAVAVTPDGTKAVSASSDHTLRVWDLASGHVIVTFTGDEEMLCCAFANNGRIIVAGGAGGTVYILSLENIE